MRFDLNSRALAAAMAAALIVIPGLLQAGVAEPRQTPQPDRLESRTIEVSLASAKKAVAQIEARSHDGTTSFRLDISSPDEHAAINVEGSRATFDDGFGLDVEKLPAAAGERVARITATAPDGRTEHAVLHVNTTTGDHREVGLDRVIALINEAPSAHLLREAMPSIGATLQAQAAASRAVRNGSASAVRLGRAKALDFGDIVEDGIWGCMGAGIVAIGSFFLAGAACLIPEPFEPLACIGALIVLAGAVVVWLDACGFI